MADGHRTITLTLTEAQHDVFLAAAETAVEVWLTQGTLRHSDRYTLKRALDRFNEAWEEGIKK